MQRTAARPLQDEAERLKDDADEVDHVGVLQLVEVRHLRPHLDVGLGGRVGGELLRVETVYFQRHLSPFVVLRASGVSEGACERRW